jgi:hypothetical protein
VNSEACILCVDCLDNFSIGTSPDYSFDLVSVCNVPAVEHGFSAKVQVH